MKMKKAVVALAVVATLSDFGGIMPTGIGIPFVGMTANAYDEAEMIQSDGFGSVPAGMPINRGKLMARRAAIVDAQRNLLESIKGISVDSETTMENYIVTSDLVKTKINGVVTGARIVSEEFKDGTYHVVMAAPLYGIGSVGDVAIRAVVGNNEPQPMPLPSSSYVAPVENTTVPSVTTTTTTTTTVTPGQKNMSYGQGYTGLIIDAKGLPLERTFCPGIFDTNGRAIYGVHNVDPDYAVAHGVAAYAQGAEAWNRAENGMSRAGARPLIIKAVGLRERTKHQCDVVVTPEDGDRILAENQRSGFGTQYAVVLEY